MKNQTAKCISYGPEWQPDGTRERYRWIENASRGLRIVGASHDIIRTRDRHTGWYIDNFQDETVCGYVLALPGRNRKPFYAPAIKDPCNPDCYVIDFHNASSDKEETARIADGMAEQYAEREREYQAKEAATEAIAQARDDICYARGIVRQLVRDLRTAGHALPPSTRETVRLRIRALRESVHAMHKRIEELTSNPYVMMEG